jgi:hypothetical protein
MTPSHSNRDGVRYRYYVSHTLLQRREKDAGRVTRVPAIQLEKLVVKAIRAQAQPDTEPKDDLSDRAVIDRYVTRIIVRSYSIDIELNEPTLAPEPLPATDALVAAAAASSPSVISLPWTAPAFASVKGILHQPEAKPMLKQETRDAILLAVAKAGLGSNTSHRAAFNRSPRSQSAKERWKGTFAFLRHLRSSLHVHWPRSLMARARKMPP